MPNLHTLEYTCYEKVISNFHSPVSSLRCKFDSNTRPGIARTVKQLAMDRRIIRPYRPVVKVNSETKPFLSGLFPLFTWLVWTIEHSAVEANVIVVLTDHKLTRQRCENIIEIEFFVNTFDENNKMKMLTLKCKEKRKFDVCGIIFPSRNLRYRLEWRLKNVKRNFVG